MTFINSKLICLINLNIKYMKTYTEGEQWSTPKEDLSFIQRHPLISVIGGWGLVIAAIVIIVWLLLP